MVPGEPVTVRVPMQSTAYAVPAGHRLRLAVSSTYWPWIWPSPEPVTLTVVSGGESRLELPVRSASELDATLPPFGPPEAAPGAEIEYRRIGPTGRTVSRDLATEALDVAFLWKDRAEVLTASATEMAERNEVHYRLTEGDPLSAEVVVDVEVELARGADWRTGVRPTAR